MPDSISILDAIAGDTGSFLVTSTQAEQKAKENFRSGERILGEISNLYDTAASNAELVKRTELVAQQSAQLATLKVANAGGINPLLAGDALTELIGKVNTNRQDLEKNLNIVKEYASPEGFVDGFLKAMAMPTAVKRAEASQAQLNASSDALAKLNKAVQESAQTHKLIAESITAASIEASAKNASIEAQIAAKKAALEGLKYNTLEVSEAVSAGKDRLNSLYHLETAKRQEEQNNRALEELNLSKERFAWQKAEKTIADQAREEGKKVDESFAEIINLGEAVLGQPTSSGPQLKSRIALLKAGTSKDINILYEIGQRAKMTGKGIIGTSPAESLAVINTTPVDIPAQQERVVGLLKSAENAVANSPKIDKKDPKAVQVAINELTKQAIAEQYRVITDQSIFNIGDLGGYIKTPQGTGISTILALPVTKKVLLPAVEAGQSLSDPRMVLSLVTSAMKAGTITSTQAADLATAYRSANEINQSALGLIKYGIVVPENGKAYKIKAGLFQGTIDMANPVDLASYFNRQLAREFINSKNAPDTQNTVEFLQREIGVGQ
jgi:hypothetical protein